MAKLSTPAPRTVRCAIYTRKSSEEGLDQDFNSLHAQREACEAYVRSQIGEGWKALPAQYDDGGYSGGNIERPALQRLLADIDRGAIDIVVVYKIDRLTRSLMDFAKIVDRFDAQGASFVSVTQSFNTTTSMGRLTLNVLLSFAQFEREVTGERIRDKLAASKKKGLWMGGNLPLGYDADGRTLKINEPEAEQVRHIFRRYLELRSVHHLCRELEVQGYRSKIRTTLAGAVIGGLVMRRGALFHLLSNRVYLGEVPHKTESYPGLHAPIIDRQLFDAVQAVLETNRVVRSDASLRSKSQAPLAGRIFDQAGQPMSPTFSCSEHARRRYRYYVSTGAQRGGNAKGDIQRLSALQVERAVLELLHRWCADRLDSSWDSAGRALLQLDVHAEHLLARLSCSTMKLPHEDSREVLRLVESTLVSGERAWLDERDELWVRAPVRLVFRGGRTWFLSGQHGRGHAKWELDRSLVQALMKAHDIAVKAGVSAGRPSEVETRETRQMDPYERKLVRLSFLAPDIQRLIVTGRQPPMMMLQDLMTAQFSPCWAEQRRRLGITSSE